MYSFGSVSAVGSWFCISVTRSVRKSLAEMVVSPLLLPVPELLEVSSMAFVLISGFACGAVGEFQIPETADMFPPCLCCVDLCEDRNPSVVRWRKEFRICVACAERGRVGCLSEDLLR